MLLIKWWKNKNVFPLGVKYCVECNLSNQQPTSINEYFHVKDTNRLKSIDKNGVCAACNFNKKWNNTIIGTKEKIFNYSISTETNGEYDCIVGEVVVKQGFSITVLKHKYNMNIDCTWSPHLYTDIGGKILKLDSVGGFDNFLFLKWKGACN